MGNQVLTPSRAIRRPRHLDIRAVVSVLVALAALGGMLAYANSLSATRPVLVATRDLPLGAILAHDDLTIAQVRVDDRIYAAAVPGEALGQVLGRPLAGPVYSQQLLGHAQISDRPRLAPDQLALTIAITPASAAGGRLGAGDEVRILLTRNKGRPEADTLVVLERVRIYDVGYDERASVIPPSPAHGGVGPVTSLTLAVTAEQARLLANAKHSGELDVALLPPAPAPLPTAPPAVASPTAIRP